MIDKYKEIYRKEVLPKKCISNNNGQYLAETISILEDFRIFRDRANSAALEGDGG